MNLFPFVACAVGNLDLAPKINVPVPADFHALDISRYAAVIEHDRAMIGIGTERDGTCDEMADIENTFCGFFDTGDIEIVELLTDNSNAIDETGASSQLLRFGPAAMRSIISISPV